MVKFVNIIVILVSATSSILIFSIWYTFIRKNNNYVKLPVFNNVPNVARVEKDFGLVYISGALLIWSLIGIFRVGLNSEISSLIIPVLSTLNSTFFLFSTTYLKHSNRHIRSKRRRTELTLLIICLCVIFTTIIFFFIWHKHTALPDFILSLVTAIVFGHSLSNTFWSRNLKILSGFSIFTVLLLVLTQTELSNLLQESSIGFLHPIVSLYSKISFIFIICFLAYSWAQENLNIVNSKIETLNLKVDKLKTAIDRQKIEADNAWKEISLNASHRLGIPINNIHLYNNLAIKQLRNRNTEGAVLQLEQVGEFILDVKRVLKDFQATGVNTELKLKKTDIVKLAHSIIKGFSGQGIQFEVINLSRKSKANFTPGRNRHDVIVSFDYEEESIELLVDQDKIKDCINELISNSTHFFDKEEKKIKIEFEVFYEDNFDSRDKWLKIVFQDNGVGIAEDKKEWIFEYFQSTYVHGSGQGLCIVRRYVELHSGNIVENGKLGNGARFEINLPVKILHDEKYEHIDRRG